MIKKRLFACVCAAVLTLSLTGCSASTSVSTNDNKEGDTKVYERTKVFELFSK